MRGSLTSREHTETVLLVEDDALVRELLAEFLEGAGYTVIEAPDAEHAIALAAASAPPITLLITDVILPGQSGPDLAEALTAVTPGLKTIFVSGFCGDQLLKSVALPNDVPILTKPFSRLAFLRTVRNVLP